MHDYSKNNVFELTTLMSNYIVIHCHNRLFNGCTNLISEIYLQNASILAIPQIMLNIIPLHVITSAVW